MRILTFCPELAPHIHRLSNQMKDFPSVDFVEIEDVNSLLRIKGDALILYVLKDIEEPVLLGIKDFKKRKSVQPRGLELASFLERMESIGRIRRAKIIGVPEQMDESVLSSLGELIQEQSARS